MSTNREYLWEELTKDITREMVCFQVQSFATCCSLLVRWAKDVCWNLKEQYSRHSVYKL